MSVELLRIHAVEISIPMYLRYTGPCMHVRTHGVYGNCKLQFCARVCTILRWPHSFH